MQQANREQDQQPADDAIAAVRRFNRVWTQQIGVLNESLLETSYSLTEARILYELAHDDGVLASELAARLGLDPGYLSRILARFTRVGIIERVNSTVDARRTHLHLTAAGRAQFATLDSRQDGAVGAMLASISRADRSRMLDAMATLERLVSPGTETGADAEPPFVLRSHRPGDLGWVVWRHGVLYAREYGWDATFEGMVARIIADFVDNFDPAWEHCWIAERAGENIGSVFLVRQSESVAKLRMLIVEPSARGLGVGRTLVAECLRFAREKGYVKMVLWTNDILHAARKIYLAEGFTLVEEERHESFGKSLVGQTWELVL